MRKTLFIGFLSVLTLLILFTGCSKPKPVPVSERIAKVWTASKVDENSQTVYTRGAASNVRNYASFKLDLSRAPTVQFTEFDGNTFVGQYSVPDDNTLRLTGLTPQPNETGGTITFTIREITDNSLVLARNEPNRKTGNTNNVYTLSNP